jgi:hypothetical protein
MLTQPDYDRIAEALNRAMHRTPSAGKFHVGEAVKVLAYEFSAADVRFDIARFVEYCLK